MQVFKVDFGGMMVTMFRNPAMRDGDVILSPTLYEKVQHFFLNMAKKEDEVEVLRKEDKGPDTNIPIPAPLPQGWNTKPVVDMDMSGTDEDLHSRMMKMDRDIDFMKMSNTTVGSVMEATGIKYDGHFFSHPKTNSHASIVPVLRELAEWKPAEPVFKRGRLVWDNVNGCKFTEDPFGDIVIAEHPFKNNQAQGGGK